MATPSGELHINKPELLSRRRRMGDAFVTGLMWMLYSYLWAPLISLVAWLLGFEFAYDVMIRSGGAYGLKSVLVSFFLMVAGIVIVVTGWSFVNRIRFANSNRRQAGDTISDESLAIAFGIGKANLRGLRSARVVKLSLDEAGNIQAIDDTPLPQRERGGQSDELQLRNPSRAAK